MALPALANWEATRDALHQIALVVGAIRVDCTDPLPNDLHFSVDVTATGLSSTKMRCGGVLDFDFAALQLSFVRGACTVFTVDVAGHSQISLMHKLLAIFGDCGYGMQPSMKHITHEEEFQIDRGMVKDYLVTLNAMYTALARFRGKLGGFMTPLVLWPHHFDMAFIWFPTKGTDEHNDPQIAFGFAPFSTGMERPYIYAYAWSKPGGYAQIALEEPAQAINEGYTGLYVDYDSLRQQDDFNAAVEGMLMNYQGLAVAQLL